MADPDKVPGEGDIICVQCGLNLLTGQQIQQPGRVRETPAKRRRPAWIFYAAAPALLVLTAAAIGVAYFLTKDPVKEAVALAAANNTLEAKHILDGHIEKRPDDIPALMLRGKLLWKQQDYTAAASDFEAVLVKEPRNEAAATLAALSVSQLKDPARQTALYQRILEASPDNAMAQRLLALTQGASGKYDDLVAALERMSGETGSEAFTLQMRGAALALLDRRSEAELSFTDAAKTGDDTGVSTLAQGLLASMNGDDEKAKQLLGTVQGTGPEVSALASARLGLLHMARGDYEAALPLLRRANENGGRDESAFFHAVCLRQLRLTQEAKQALTTMRDARGEYASQAALELALMALDGNDVEQAEENLRQAQAKGTVSAKMQTVQGKIYLARGQDVEAQSTFKQAIQTDPEYAPAHLENGLLYVKRSITDEGIKSLQKYLDLAGDTVAGGVPEVRLLLSQLQQTAPGAAGQEAQ
jgi:tetratricopeptide (TPR) repeat protein